VVTARDRRTLEIRQAFPLPETGEGVSYESDAYLFFPRSFGVTGRTWGVDGFYRDAHVYLRLTSTGLGLQDLRDPNLATNPACILRDQLPRLLDENAPDGETLSTLAQMFGAEFADAVEREAKRLRALVRRGGEDERGFSEPAYIEALVRGFCEAALGALGTLRRLRAKAAAYRAVAPPKLFDALSFAEEYGCAVLDEELSELGKLVDEASWMRDGAAVATKVRLHIAHAARAVNRRRRDQGFAVPWGSSPEYFSYRIGLLKKELQRALYIDTRRVKADPLYRNTAAMVAAGLAATWATLAQLPLWTGGWSSREGVYFLFVAVGAYILKDRIKEWVRNGLVSRLAQWDHDRRFAGDVLRRVGLGLFTGRGRERVRFVDDDDLPKDVRKARVKHRTVRGVVPELEQIVHYQRTVELRQPEQERVPEGFSVQEIMRLSLDRLLERLDDPVDDVAFFDDETGRFTSQSMPKVYHLNLVLVTKDSKASNGDGESHLSRYRIVLNRKGIVRIDNVLDRRRSKRQKAARAA
jgi:hypothetical protein